jgi:radical SAM protein with 4Fe4S-binding SPASM domain
MITNDHRRFALGVGLTNACNLSCAHCYRGTGTDALRAADVIAAVQALPTRAVNFGTGENGLHPDFASIVEELARRGVAVTMTTNGHSAVVLSDQTLALFKDVEFSIDYPSEEAHDAARGAGNWALIESQMARCRALGVGVTLVSVLMSTNYRAMAALARLAAMRGALLRVNVYQAVRGDAFSLSYEQFWDAFAALLAAGDLVACGEPVVRAVLGIPPTPGAGCGVETVRLTPRGSVVPCVYGGDAALGLSDLERLGAAIVEDASFRALDVIPNTCKACPQVATCRGGCASRRALRGGLEGYDQYCPFLLEREVPSLSKTDAASGEGAPPPKASSACTTIIRPHRAER